MYIHVPDIREIELLPGFKARMLHSERMTFVYWAITAGAVLPEHAHEHEQVCHVHEGEFELVIAGVHHRLKAGDVAVIPSQAIHSGRALTDCRVMDVFQPVRDDYRLPDSVSAN